MKNKKLIATLLCIVVVISSLSFGLSAIAKSNANIELDKIYVDAIEGSDDKIWYTYTPKLSGTYNFINYSVGKSECYLFTRTTNADGSRQYNQIAYAGPSDPNYKDNESFVFGGATFIHNSTSFLLNCHLEKGVTYYFAAGWANSWASDDMIVRLTNVSYDKEIIESVYATSTATLDEYSNGEWRDINDSKYYHYNYSRILQNMTVTLKYKDGTTVTAKGNDSTISGYPMTITDNQLNVNWYPQGSGQYVSNALTISVQADQIYTYEYDVQIESSAMYSVKGKVVDYSTGESLVGATVSICSANYTTDSHGQFVFVYPAGVYNLTVSMPNCIERKLQLSISADTDKNDHISTPISIVTGDWVNDNVINAKDYAYCLNNGIKFDTSVLNFKQSDYAPTL